MKKLVALALVLVALLSITGAASAKAAGSIVWSSSHVLKVK